MKELTPKNYANLYGCDPCYIRKILKQGDGNSLPFVKEVKRFSRFYVLVVPKKINKVDFEFLNINPSGRGKRK
jgi:hypothetical protein